MSEEEHEKIIKELKNKYLGKCLILKDGTTTDEIIDVAVDYREEAQHMNRVNDGSKTICINDILCSTEEVLKIFEENKELKQMVLSPDLTITTCPKCGEKYSVNYCREVSDLKHILTDFEKWLEKYKKDEMFDYGNEQLNNYFNEFCDMALDKLQELKEGKK